MAIVFEMWAECSTEADCAALMRHFDGFRTRLLSGRMFHPSDRAAGCTRLKVRQIAWARHGKAMERLTSQLNFRGTITERDALSSMWYRHLS